MKESSVQQRVRLDASYNGETLWRNNVGVLVDLTGRPVRYGLANESAAENKLIKSSDCIGIKPTIITQEMVGYMIGRFLAVENKEEGWTFSEKDERAVAQARYHEIVRNAGGLAGFATCVEDYRRIVGR